MKYGGLCVSTPYLFLLRFDSSFCGSLFVNLRFHWILGPRPVNGYALNKLEQQHPRKAELVKLRFFAGLTTAQAAQSLGVSATTAENDWSYARAWLRLEMTDGRAPDTPS